MSDTIDKQEDVEFDADVFDAMLHGNFVEEVPGEADEIENEDDTDEDSDADDTADSDDIDDDADDSADDSDDDIDEDDEHQEDTDQDDESEEDEELDEDSDGDSDEDSDTDDEDEEEDTLVDDDDLDDEDNDVDEDDDEADEADDSDEADVDDVSEDDADTEELSDGKVPDTDEIDYKAFYDAVVNTEFTVNNKKVKGFADPVKIIQSQQMAGGFSEKMAGFKKYRPFMTPLKERGMLEDQAKFDLAMNLIDGDKEAIKTHLQSLNIDPVELDMEKIDYSGKSNVASQESIAIEDSLERAKHAGYEDQFRQALSKDWDAESFQEFTSNANVRNDLLTHMETGQYDTIQDKIAEMSRLDYNGAFGSKSTINRYRAAVQELQREEAARPAPVAPVEKKTPAPKKVVKKPTVNAEKAKIKKSRDEEAYKVKAAKQEAKLTQQRKKAASMSKKKAKAKPKPKFDPLALEGEEFDKHMEFLISGGRG